MSVFRVTRESAEKHCFSYEAPTPECESGIIDPISQQCIHVGEEAYNLNALRVAGDPRGSCYSAKPEEGSNHSSIGKWVIDAGKTNDPSTNMQLHNDSLRIVRENESRNRHMRNISNRNVQEQLDTVFGEHTGTEFVRSLIQLGGVLNPHHLEQAITHEDTEMVRMVFEMLGTPEITERHLRLAIESKNIETVRFLIHSGAHVTAESLSDAIRTSRAHSNSNPEIARMLIDKGARVTEEHIHEAIRSLNYTFLKLFIDMGIRVITKRNFDYAIENADERTVLLFIEHGLKATERRLDMSVLRGATYFTYYAFRISEVLIENGAPVTQHQLDIAIRNYFDQSENDNHRLDMIRLLVENGAHPQDYFNTQDRALLRTLIDAWAKYTTTRGEPTG